MAMLIEKLPIWTAYKQGMRVFMLIPDFFHITFLAPIFSIIFFYFLFIWPHIYLRTAIVLRPTGLVYIAHGTPTLAYMCTYIPQSLLLHNQPDWKGVTNTNFEIWRWWAAKVCLWHMYMLMMDALYRIYPKPKGWKGSINQARGDTSNRNGINLHRWILPYRLKKSCILLILIIVKAFFWYVNYHTSACMTPCACLCPFRTTNDRVIACGLLPYFKTEMAIRITPFQDTLNLSCCNV